MNIEWFRNMCMSLPHTTEEVLWGADLVFKIGGKMYAVSALEPGPVALSFKTTPEEFAELVERPGIIPAPYSARYHWVALENEDALPRAEIKRLVKQAYELVFAGLPKKRQAGLRDGGAPAKAARRSPKSGHR